MQDGLLVIKKVRLVLENTDGNALNAVSGANTSNTTAEVEEEEEDEEIRQNVTRLDTIQLPFNDCVSTAKPGANRKRSSVRSFTSCLVFRRFSRLLFFFSRSVDSRLVSQSDRKFQKRNAASFHRVKFIH